MPWMPPKFTIVQLVKRFLSLKRRFNMCTAIVWKVTHYCRLYSKSLVVHVIDNQIHAKLLTNGFIFYLEWMKNRQVVLYTHQMRCKMHVSYIKIIMHILCCQINDMKLRRQRNKQNQMYTFLNKYKFRQNYYLNITYPSY